MLRSFACPFFKAWSPDMAYVLGYWFADGNMYFQQSTGGYMVSIASKDLSHLTKLQQTIGVGTITRITRSDVHKLVICRKEMYDDLRHLGGTERKSLTLLWPHVPDQFLAHFVRGYIDGDGSLTWHRSGRSEHPLMCAIGTKSFLTGMIQAIEAEAGIPMPVCHLNNSSDTWAVKWYGVRAKCLAIWLYHHHNGICLGRKYKLAETFIQWKPKIFDPTTTTPKMWKQFEKYLP